MTRLHQFECKLVAHWPPKDWQDLTVLVAVSGGVDSVGLLRGMTAVKPAGPGSLYAAHFHHGLRNEDADRDQAFVQQLCVELGVPCRIGRADVGRQAKSDRNGLEAAARDARYRFLQQTAEQVGARYVATAHTADDQVETILHHVLRGSGLAGLAGMPRARPLGEAVTLIRPLLAFRRTELVAYLRSLGQSYRQDATNLDTRFTRNRIRHQLLPVLAEQYNPAIVEALLRLGCLARDARQVIDRVADDLSEQCVRTKNKDSVQIDCRLLSTQPRYLIREVLITVWRQQGWPQQSMGYQQWDELASRVLAQPDDPATAQRVFPGMVTATRQGAHLRLTRPRE